MKVNIIADIAGRYNELIKLLAVMPKADKIVLVGDLVDRGPDSKKVVEWAMKGEYEGVPVITLKGNHEDMFVGMYETQSIGYPQNGQFSTLQSYEVNDPSELPESHVNWMNKLPLYFKTEGLFVSHAPWSLTLNETTDSYLQNLNYFQQQDLIWNRKDPNEIPGLFQVYGHNHIMKMHDNWGICIDNCSRKVLTGFSWPDKTIYEVPYEL